MKKIKQFFFDFGGVLVDLDFQGCVQAFRNLGADMAADILSSQDDFTALMRDFEDGKIEEKEFFLLLGKTLQISVPESEMKKAWNLIIRTIPAYKLEVLKNLKKDYPVFMVSNTNITHIDHTREYLFREDGGTIDDYFDKLYFSYEVGVSKPQPGFYQRVIADSGVDPTESLFLDDRLENLEAAAKAGFQICQVLPSDCLKEKITPFLN